MFHSHQQDTNEDLNGTVRLVHVTNSPQSLFYFMAGQISYLKGQGFNPSVVAPPGERLEEFAASEQVQTTAIRINRPITPLRDLVTAWRLWRHFIRECPHIAHAHTPKGGLLGMLAATLARVPVRIYHIRGFPFVTAGRSKRLLLRWTEWVACRLAHRVFCVSHSLREVAVAEGICTAEKIRVFGQGSGNGVDSSCRFDPARLPAETRQEVRRRLGINENSLVVGYVGRIVRDKGIEDLVRAWTTVCKSCPTARLLLVGPYEQTDAISESTRRALENDERIHGVGMDWNTPPLYAAMDVMVLPSYREGFPNVLLEAAAMQLPVLTTRVPGCIDAVEDGVTGTLIPPGDPEKLAEGMTTYLNDECLRTRHGKAGRDRVLRNFAQEDIWRAIADQYRELLAERGIVATAASLPNRDTQRKKAA